MSPLPAAPPALAPPQARVGIGNGALAAAAIAALTAARLVWLTVQPADLYPDEAQYWVWAQQPGFGYYSKPPLVAWAIALTTGLFGDSEFGIRFAAPLLHAATASLVYGIGARLYDKRIGCWSALAYASLPGVSLSSFLISTDAVLLPCWAAALYSFIRAREPGGERWWVLVGVAAGFGLMAKYAMVYWLISAFGYLFLVREERRHLPYLLAATGLALLFCLPNMWWNWQHGFVSFLHVRDNAGIARNAGGPMLHPAAFLEFFGSQFGVFGPLCFAGLIATAVRRRTHADPRARLLAVFALPTLAMMLAVSLLSRAQPNWSAPTYVAATVLVTACALERAWPRLLATSAALNLTIALCVFGGAGALGAAGIALPAKYDPLHRLRGWRELGQQVAASLQAHPGLKLLATDREVIAALTYYVRPHPFDAVEWTPIPGTHDHWQLNNNIAGHTGEDFLAITEAPLAEPLASHFATFTPAGVIAIATGPGGGREYRLYVARGYSAASLR